MIITFEILISVLIIALIYVLINFNKLNRKSSDYIDKWLNSGIKSGIKDIKYRSHYIDIYFNNEVSLLNAWNANKLYGWIENGKIIYKDEKILEYHELPSLKIRRKLNTLVGEFEILRRENKINS